MKKRWLRGLLLGVSLALLLGGGVAMAAGLFARVSKPCVVCWPGDGEMPTQEQYLFTFTFGGWDPSYDLCVRAAIDGHKLFVFCGSPPLVDPVVVPGYVPCEWQRQELPTSILGHDVRPLPNGPPDRFGEWEYRLWQENPPGTVVDWAVARWLVVEDISECPMEEEFVPEAGSILLLGSGLMGLAGYATLRLRSGQALRWRTRE